VIVTQSVQNGAAWFAIDGKIKVNCGRAVLLAGRSV